eukprot:4352283-Lingulodinium_polyedra.AAC.1
MKPWLASKHTLPDCPRCPGDRVIPLGPVTSWDWRQRLGQRADIRSWFYMPRQQGWYTQQSWTP